jgi:formate-dependent nitrite reductase membrane component NrfD
LNFSDFEFEEDLSKGFGDLALVVTLVIAATIVVVILFGILAVKIGAGRRWAQVTTIVVMLLAFVSGFIGIYTGFEASSQTGAPADGSRLIMTLLSLAMPLVTLLCLFTGSANQWFRQKGRDPLKGLPPQSPPAVPYRSY